MLTSELAIEPEFLGVPLWKAASSLGAKATEAMGQKLLDTHGYQGQEIETMGNRNQGKQIEAMGNRNQGKQIEVMGNMNQGKQIEAMGNVNQGKQIEAMGNGNQGKQ